MDAIRNFAKAVLSTGNYDEAVTEIDLIGGTDVGRFPAPPFNAVWWNITDYPDPSDDPGVEIIRVTDRTDETLTITRAQEETVAVDHNLAGKTYALVAGLTARTIREMVGNVLTGAQPFIAVDSESVVDNIVIASSTVSIGDVQGEGNSTSISVDDPTNRVVLVGKVSTDQSASASVAVGTLAAKMPIYDAAGTLLGYIPIYNSIT